MNQGTVGQFQTQERSILGKGPEMQAQLSFKAMTTKWKQNETFH